MNGRFDLRIITQPHSEVHVYCGYFRRLVFGNSLTSSHIPPCFHAKPPDFPRLFESRVVGTSNRRTNRLLYKEMTWMRNGNAHAGHMITDISRTPPNTSIDLIGQYGGQSN